MLLRAATRRGNLEQPLDLCGAEQAGRSAPEKNGLDRSPPHQGQFGFEVTQQRVGIIARGRIVAGRVKGVLQRFDRFIRLSLLVKGTEAQ